MAAFRMAPSLITGDIQIDNEHEHLLVLADRFADFLKANNDEGCAGTIVELTEALESHIENEEKIMARYGYTNLEEHKEQHEKGKKRYDALLKKTARHGYNNGFFDDLIAILADDLITLDMDFRGYLKKMSHKG